MSLNNRDAAKFIDRIYADLYNSEEVLRHSTGKNGNKYQDIIEYLDMQETLHKRASSRANRKRMLKTFYHDKYVIKPNNIPESLFETEKRIALESGHGYSKMSNIKRKVRRRIINDQEKSLDEWLDYFLSNDANMYPFWAKYWAFQGMLRLGSYDSKNGKYNRRTEHTAAPFIELNREALSLSIDAMIKVLNKQQISDTELEILVKSGSFQKIYTHILHKLSSRNHNVVKNGQGIWIKYPQYSNHKKLTESLKGYGTGWCTCGETTARSQLLTGDFYVFYTLDENGEYKVPRIAIRMEGDYIVEVRGIGAGQSLEPEMESVVSKKIKDLPGNYNYYKKISDMKKLTGIYNKWKAHEELSVDELVFLYEINDKIVGFGYNDDPRIEEIKKSRNKKKDFARIYNCSEESVATSQDEFNSGTKVLCDSLSYYEESEKLVFPEILYGELYLDFEQMKLKTAEGIVFPKEVIGDVELRNLYTTKGLILPETIIGNLELRELTEIDDGLVLPKKLHGGLKLYSLESARGLVLPEVMYGQLELSMIKNCDGLKLPRIVYGDLILYSLESIEGLDFPEAIGGGLSLDSVKIIKDFSFPRTLKGSLGLTSVETLENVTLPIMIGDGSLSLDSVTNIKNTVFPEVVEGEVDLSSLQNAKDINLPKLIYGDLRLDNLVSADNVTFPERISYGFLDLKSFVYRGDIELPKYIGDNLYLGGIESIEGLDSVKVKRWIVVGDKKYKSLAELKKEFRKDHKSKQQQSEEIEDKQGSQK